MTTAANFDTLCTEADELLGPDDANQGEIVDAAEALEERDRQEEINFARYGY